MLSVVAAAPCCATAPRGWGRGDPASGAQLAALRTMPAASQPVPRLKLGIKRSLATRRSSATATLLDRDLPRRQRLLGEIIVVISGRHIPRYAVEHPQDREL